MKTTWRTTLGAAVFVAALTLLNPRFSSCRAQGSLTPPGAPAPTMKTLEQIEPRTPISSVPFTISQPGSYYLTTNLSVSSGTAITIATNGVTLDLNGFTLSSSDPANTGDGILINSGLKNLTIMNGYIEGGVTNNAGVFSGPGFGYGIRNLGSVPRNVRVSGVTVSGCRYDGINVGSGQATLVEGCLAQTVGNVGIRANTIKGSVAKECGNTAIYGNQVSDSRGESIGGHGLYALNSQNCYGSSSSGTGLYAYTAQNCYGYSGGSGIGLFADYTALNCSGYCYSGTGLYASTAQNCYGSSSSGYGLSAYTALNCYGLSNSGYGLYAYYTAQNCYGQSSSGPAGLYAQNASFCTGYRSGGRAIEATIANGCWAAAGTNLITYKYNMP
jgi:hypothetical protein